MDVTNSNFASILPEVEQAIKEADVLAIDGEFTGLQKAGCNIHSFDIPETRYQKLRQNAMDFLVVQFGLSTFQYDEEEEKYIVKAFNFYVFPRPFSRQAPDVRFTCQASSIDFLMKENFDYNKVFREGISYLSFTDEQRLRESLEKRHAHISAANALSPAFVSPMTDTGNLCKGPIEIPDEHKNFIKDIGDSIEEFLQTEEEKLTLLPCNGYLRKLIFQSMTQRFRGSIHLDSQTTNQGNQRWRQIVVTRVTGEDDFQRREEAKRAAEMKQLDDAVGFSKVIKMISESGKLLVGHNMVLDLLHTIHKFRCPLPEDYEDFKSCTQCIFPRIIDTKLMASTHPFKDIIFNTVLGDLQKTLEAQPFVKPKIEFAEGYGSYNTTTEQLHEAGYDAYITGLCYITMANFLGAYQSPVLTHVPTTSDLVQPFLNKLFLMRVYDVPYINLAGPDLTPCRDHVFHLTFPREWKSADVIHLFSAFGNIQITWLDDTSAFVALFKKDEVDLVMRQLSHADNYRLMTYADYMQQRTVFETPISGSRGKRKMPASDVDLPAKRKRSLESGSPFPSRHSITPILEEEEPAADEGHHGNGDAAGNNNGDEVPAKKKKLDLKGENKLFEESADWA